MNICILMQREPKWLRSLNTHIVCSYSRTLWAMRDKSYTRIHNASISELSKSYSMWYRVRRFYASLSGCINSTQSYSTTMTKGNFDIKCSATWTKKKVLDKIRVRLIRGSV